MATATIDRHPTMKRKVHVGFIHTITALIVVPATWLAVLVWYPSPTIVTWNSAGKFIPAKAAAGDWVEIYREVDVLETFTAHITRTFVQKQLDGTVLYIEATPVDREFNKGHYEQLRPFKIPCTMTKGEWELVTTLTYLDFLGRTINVTPPVLKLTVTSDCDGLRSK